MTHTIKTAIHQLIQKLNKSETNSLIAQTQTQIICYINQVQKQKLIDIMNVVIELLQDKYFQHIFKYFMTDHQFINNYKQQLITLLISKLTICGNGLQILSRTKKLLLVKLLLNSNINLSNDQSKTAYKSIAWIIIEQRCRSEINICYSLLWNINNQLKQLSIKQLEKYNINDILLLVTRVIKSYNKLPNHLIDQAFRFINQIFLSRYILDQSNQSIPQQILSICSMVQVKAYQMIKINNYQLGNVFRFISIIMPVYNQFKNVKDKNNQLINLTNLVKYLTLQLDNIFPDLQQLTPNALQLQIQKISQFYDFTEQNEQNNLNQLNQRNKVDNKNQKSKQKMNKKIEQKLRIQLLKAVSEYIKSLFIYIINQQQKYLANPQYLSNSSSNKNTKSNNIIDQILTNRNQIKKYVKIYQMLSYCNDKQIFNNFIFIYSKKDKLKQLFNIQFNLTQQHINKQIVRNCPTPTQQNCSTSIQYKCPSSIQQSIQLKKPQIIKRQQKQLNQIICCLSKRINKLIAQGHLNQLLQLIKDKIQKQYDQSFNIRQFQSATNTLTLIFRVITNSINNNNHVNNLSQIVQQKNQSQVVQQNNQSQHILNQYISKNQIIEWIKMLFNLNQSCLPQFRKYIVSKTYQLLSQIFPIVLPHNQYLQQVIQNQLILKSYPLKSNILQKLFLFYQAHAYSIFQNGYSNKSDFHRFNSLFNNSMQQQTDKFKHVSNSQIRKLKILQRIYTKLQDQKLNIQQRKYLWSLVLRVHKISVSHDLINLQKINKLFINRPQILLARHQFSKEITQESDKRVFELNSQEIKIISKQLKKHPIFYSNELKVLNNVQGDE